MAQESSCRCQAGLHAPSAGLLSGLFGWTRTGAQMSPPGYTQLEASHLQLLLSLNIWAELSCSPGQHPWVLPSSK